MMLIHRASGIQGLHKDAPQFANLVDHIVRHVGILQNLKKSASAKSKKSILPDLTTLPPQESDLSTIPADLYGLWALSKGASVVKLPIIKNSLLKPGVDGLYAASEFCLQELLSKQVIFPKLKVIDQNLVTSRTSSFNDVIVFQRSITRGAILWSIANTCGTVGIFASSHIDKFLESPAIIFESAISRERSFSPEVLKRKEEVLQPLTTWISSHLIEFPNISFLAQKLGHYADHQMSELYAGVSLPLDFDDDSSTIPEYPSQTTHDHISKQTSSKWRTQLDTIQNSNISIDFKSLILPGKQSDFSLSAIGFILREALNREKKLPVGNYILRRILDGLHTTQSSTKKFNPDHTNPLRKRMYGALLLCHHLPGFRVTSRIGICNLLSWLGTGQGYQTQEFLDQIGRSTGFFASNLLEMTETFEIVLSGNARKSADIPGHQQAKGVIQIDDMFIWGQPSNYLSATPTKLGAGRNGPKMTLKDKFSPYWSDKVQDAWVDFLGDMIDCNPINYQKTKPRWSDVGPFLDLINVPTFKTGLTRLQLANYLVSLNIVDAPSSDEIARWIHVHPKLGAFHGLQQLGFCLVTSNINTTRAAFACVYRHLDENLTQDDKKISSFGPIFVEHLLCKIARWHSRLATEMPELLDELALQVKNQSIIVYDIFPFPLSVDKEWIKEVIVDIIVS